MTAHASKAAGVQTGNTSRAATGDPAEPHLRLQDVTVRFGQAEQSVVALRSASLEVGRGEFVALVGPSGCGKSTILKLVGGLVRPTMGAVQVGTGGEAPRMGMAFQIPRCCLG